MILSRHQVYTLKDILEQEALKDIFMGDGEVVADCV